MKNKVKKLVLAGVVATSVLANMVSVSAIERVYILPSTTQQKAPKNNVFQLKGSSDKFILLDTTDEGYFVLAGKNYASKPIAKDGTATPFDPQNPNSIAHWLNGEFLESNSLPEVIKESLVEREYTTEGGGSKVTFSKEYKTTCKVVILSQTEWSKYNAKFGYADDTSSGFWALRSVRELTGSPLVAATSAPNSGLTVDGKWGSSLGIRPAFYLSKDFFEKAYVDMENSGDTVLSIIRKNYTEEALLSVYSTNEVVNLMESDIAPVADSVNIVGRGIVGETINGSYSFVSLDNNDESGTLIQWQKSLDGKTWSSILNTNTKDFVPTEAEVGYFVRMKVSPMTSSMAGASFTSVALATPIRAISKPVATDVRILASGDIRPGNILDVKYVYSDENRDQCSTTDYVWEESEDKLVTQVIGNERNLKLENSHGGKYVRVGVTPKKKTNSASGRVEVAGERVYSDWIEVKDLPIVDSVKITREADASVTLTKTEDTVSIKGLLTAVFGRSIEKLTADYTFEAGEGYDVICSWQGSSEKDGTYAQITSGSYSLEFVPEGTAWVRAKVFAKNEDGIGKAVYSEPMYVGEEKASLYEGTALVTQSLTKGKKYEIWIVNEGSSNSYTYSFRLTAGQIPTVSSDNYLVKNLQSAGGTLVIGTMVSDTYTSATSFKAGEITAESNMEITISDAKTATVGNTPVTNAMIFILEK